MEIIVEIAGFV